MDKVFEAFRNCISDRKCENKDCPYEGKCQIANGRDQWIQIPKHLALDVLNILKEQEPHAAWVMEEDVNEDQELSTAG